MHSQWESVDNGREERDLPHLQDSEKCTPLPGGNLSLCAARRGKYDCEYKGDGGNKASRPESIRRHHKEAPLELQESAAAAEMSPQCVGLQASVHLQRRVPALLFRSQRP